MAKHGKIQLQGMLLYLLVAIIPTIVLFGVYLRSLTLQMENEVLQTMQQTLNQAVISIENDLDDLKRVSDYLFVSASINESMATDAGSQTVEDQIQELDLIRLKNDSATIGMIQQVQKTIRERYSENLTINELAAQVYLTPTYLCLLFRQVTGTTINRYLTNVRMEKAKELLMDLSNKLYDVSYAVGYINPSYFSRQFKKYVGCLPSEYRNRRMSRE